MLAMRAWMAGTTLLAFAALAALTGTSGADDAEDLKAQTKMIQAIATKLKADKAEGLKMAADFAKKLDTVEHIMHGFNRAKKGGHGVGAMPGEITPDGIELYINQAQRDGISAAALAKQAKAIEDVAYISAAVAEVAGNYDMKGPGGRKRDLKDFAARASDASFNLAAAAQAKDSARIEAAAGMLNDACNACHTALRAGLPRRAARPAAAEKMMGEPGFLLYA